MKILVLNYEYPPLGGGASPVSKEIAERYVLAGHQVEVVTMGHKTLPTYEEASGIKVHRLKCLRSKLNICHPHEQLSFLWVAKRFLKAYLQSNQFDVCHCHFLIPTGILASWLKKQYSIPYIVTIHGSDVPGYNPDRFKFLHNFTPSLLRDVISNASMVTSPSEYLASLLMNLKSIDFSNKVEVIANGIETKGFNDLVKKKIILSTGRLLERKGFKTLCNAFSALDTDYELHICGDGPLMPELESIAKSSKNTIKLHGWIDNKSEEYLTLLGQAQIYALVSSHENASIAILEAMANKCAIISSNGTGCKEMVEDVGLIIRPNDEAELNKAIIKLIEDEDLRVELGQKAYTKVCSSYNWDEIVSTYLKCLSSAISGS